MGYMPYSLLNVARALSSSKVGIFIHKIVNNILLYITYNNNIPYYIYKYLIQRYIYLFYIFHLMNPNMLRCLVKSAFIQIDHETSNLIV